MHLISTYGALYKRILSTIGRHKETAIRVDLEVPMIVAELKYAIENEWVTCVEDFLFRRTYYGYLFHKEPDVLAAFSMAFNQLFDCKPNNSALPTLKQIRNDNA
jgi:glycerol-3-phosphate dehydrogenase